MKKIMFFVVMVFVSAFAAAGTPSLSGPAYSTGSITLTPNQPESPYFLTDIWRKAPGGSWAALGVTYGSYAYTDSVGTSGQYQYRSRWFNPSAPEGQQYSYWGNTVYVDVSISGIPTPTPTVYAPSTDSDGTFTVSWSTSTGASYYQLQRKIGTGSWSTQQSSSATSRSYSSLPAGSYSFRARACNSIGCTAFSSVKTVVVTSPVQVPAAPASVTYLPSPTNVVYWSDVSGATYYIMEYYSSSGWIQYYNGTGTGTTVGATGATWFRVKACNSNGCSGYKYSS